MDAQSFPLICLSLPLGLLLPVSALSTAVEAPAWVDNETPLVKGSASLRSAEAEYDDPNPEDFDLYRENSGHFDDGNFRKVTEDEEDTIAHLGRVSSGGSNATYSPSTYGPGVGFDLALYCGTRDTESADNLVASVSIPKIRNWLYVGTHSSGAALISLSASLGTLAPAFQRNVTSYTIPDVANDYDQLTVHASEQVGYDTFFVWNRSWGAIRACEVNGRNCGSWGYGRDSVILQDPNLGAPGFQINLDVGENTFDIHAAPSHGFSASEFYAFSVTRRAPNNPATGSPAITGTAQVGETLTADTSGISDTDGLANASYTYQWLASRDTEIDGATGSTYVLTDSDAARPSR